MNKALEFSQILALLKIEQEEDYKLYQKYIVQTPLQERKQKGFSWYPITITHTEIGTGENFYLSLERKPQANDASAFQVGDVVSLFCNAAQHPKTPNITAIITAIWKNTMRIALHTDELPDWLDDGHLGIDLLFDNNSYKEMEIALKKVMDAKEGRLAELRQVLTGNIPAQYWKEHEIKPFQYNPYLNDSQNIAVKNILLAKDVAVIHGPPGTGKTTTLVEAIRQTLFSEKQVLVVAPSNTATDLLTQKLAQQGIKVLRIGNPARIDENLIDYSLDTQISYHADYKNLKDLRKRAEEFKKMAHKYKRNYGQAEREQKRLLFIEAKQALLEATILEKYIIDKLLQDANAITATLVGSMHKYIKNKQFSTVFIDEAAQALEPATWIPIIKTQKVVLAGDHHQLPPTVKSYEAAQKGLNITLFEKIINISQAQKQTIEVMLDTQYRMNERIMQFSNQQFYNNQLKADISVKNKGLFDNIPDADEQPLEWIDTAGCSFNEKEDGESKSNPDEALILFKHLENLITKLQNSTKVLQDNFSIGIISPYKAQINFLRENIKVHEVLKHFQSWININTIDGFQGQEREIIYISLVRSNDKGEIGFLQDTRRMNVAMTRAKTKLIMIGDSATVGSHPFYQQLLAYIESIDAYHTAWEWIN